MGVPAKTRHEGFARFFEAPNREGLRDLLQHNGGEHRACDFKQEWPDYPSLARHVLALGNHGGGCLIAGVKEEEDKTLTPSGLIELRDKIEIDKGLRKYVPDHLMNSIEVIDFSYTSSEYAAIVGKKFQILMVSSADDYTPFLALKDGDGIRSNTVYVRRDAGTAEASNEELQRIISRRIDSGHSSAKEIDLQIHMDQLKILYEYVPRHYSAFKALNLAALGGLNYIKNERAPKEDFADFVGRVIKEKKVLIERELGIRGRLRGEA